MPDFSSALLDGRRAAESLMLDTGTAKRPTGGYEYDSGTGSDVEAMSDLFGTAPDSVACKVKPPRTVAREAEAGGRTVVTIPGELHLPADPDHPEYASLRVGDIWEIVTVDPMSLSQVGRRYRITSEADGTLVTACRYSVERTTT